MLYIMFWFTSESNAENVLESSFEEQLFFAAPTSPLAPVHSGESAESSYISFIDIKNLIELVDQSWFQKPEENSLESPSLCS